MGKLAREADALFVSDNEMFVLELVKKRFKLFLRNSAFLRKEREGDRIMLCENA